MGLDMYLSRKTYVKNWDFMDDSEKHEITVKGPHAELIDISKVIYIEEQVGYWRKANQIHQWFVDNVQDGRDDCGEYYVDHDKLKELLSLCKRVLKTAELVEGNVNVGATISNGELVQNYEKGKVIANAEEVAELLPTASGFFFGGTDYDEWYLQNIKDTVEMLEELDLDNYDQSYYYYSSW